MVMGKVKITREQADAIKRIEDVDYAINIHGLNKRPDSPLAELETSQLVRALYIGYEVEKPKLIEGDWVTASDGTIGMLRKVPNSNIYNDFYVDSIGYRVAERPRLSDLKHSTSEEVAKEKERRFWRSNGRDVWELREGDVLSKVYPKLIYHFEVDYANKDCVKLIGDSERYIKDVKDHYKIVCFAEDRKDTKGDEVVD